MFVFPEVSKTQIERYNSGKLKPVLLYESTKLSVTLIDSFAFQSFYDQYSTGDARFSQLYTSLVTCEVDIPAQMQKNPKAELYAAYCVGSGSHVDVFMVESLREAMELTLEIAKNRPGCERCVLTRLAYRVPKNELH